MLDRGWEMLGAELLEELFIDFFYEQSSVVHHDGLR